MVLIPARIALMSVSNPLCLTVFWKVRPCLSCSLRGLHLLAVYPKRRCPAARRLGDGWLFHFLFPFDGGIGVSSRPFHQFPYSGHRAQCGCSIFVCHTPYPGDEHHSVVSAFGQCLGLVLCIRQTPAPCLVCFVGGGIYRVLYTGV